MGNLKKAEEFLTKALTTCLKLFGENHRDVAICDNSLGNLYLNLGYLQKAEEFLMRAMAISLELFGENNGDVANCYNNLGNL